MKCPVCPDVVLMMSVRSQIEIDYCPSCRGVWLDRGELDKIIEKSLAEKPEVQNPTPPPREKIADTIYRESSHNNYSNDHYKYKKKKSFLEELFD